MKPVNQLIEAVYDALLEVPGLSDYLGTFSDSSNPENAPVAIAAGTPEENYTVPAKDKVFIIFNLESSSPIRSETKSHLQNISLKFYIGGYDAHAVADLITGYLTSRQLYNYVVSYGGFNSVNNGDITLRFNLI